MDTIRLEKDLIVFYVTAKSFPEGIQEATDKLHELVPFSEGRKYFGISRPENGGAIIYRAGAEEMNPGEAKELGCDTLTLKKGNYAALAVHDFRKDIMSIDRAFKELLQQPDLDPHGYCVEWYATDNKSVKCMIRLNQ